MNKQAAAPQKSRSEQETENEANRLIAQVEEALAAVATRLHDEDNALESSADRVERAARDFVAALRELAQERRTSQNES
jgi:hypothetical protein